MGRKYYENMQTTIKLENMIMKFNYEKFLTWQLTHLTIKETI